MTFVQFDYFIFVATICSVIIFFIFLKSLNVDLRTLCQKRKPLKHNEIGTYLNLVQSRSSARSLTIEQPLARGWAYTTKRIIGTGAYSIPEEEEDVVELQLSDIKAREDSLSMTSGFTTITVPIATPSKSLSALVTPIE